MNDSSFTGGISFSQGRTYSKESAVLPCLIALKIHTCFPPTAACRVQGYYKFPVIGKRSTRFVSTWPRPSLWRLLYWKPNSDQRNASPTNLAAGCPADWLMCGRNTIPLGSARSWKPATKRSPNWRRRSATGLSCPLEPRVTEKPRSP